MRKGLTVAAPYRETHARAEAASETDPSEERKSSMYSRARR